MPLAPEMQTEERVYELLNTLSSELKVQLLRVLTETLVSATEEQLKVLCVLSTVQTWLI